MVKGGIFYVPRPTANELDKIMTNERCTRAEAFRILTNLAKIGERAIPVIKERKK